MALMTENVSNKRLKKICCILFVVFSVILLLSSVVEIGIDNEIDNMIQEEMGDDLRFISASTIKGMLRGFLLDGVVPGLDTIGGILGTEDWMQDILNEIIQGTVDEAINQVNPFFRFLIYFWAFGPTIRTISIIVVLASVVCWYLAGGRFSDFRRDTHRTADGNLSDKMREFRDKYASKPEKTELPKEQELHTNSQPTCDSTSATNISTTETGGSVDTEPRPKTEPPKYNSRDNMDFSNHQKVSHGSILAGVLLVFIGILVIVIFLLYQSGYSGTGAESAASSAWQSSGTTADSNNSQGHAIGTGNAGSSASDIRTTWGPWSDWSTTRPTEYSTRQIETDTRTEYGATVTVYNYKRFLYYSDQHNRWNSSNRDASNYGEGAWFEYDQEGSPLTYKRTSESGYTCYYGPVKNGNDEWWEDDPYITQERTTRQVTYYRYRDMVTGGTSASSGSQGSSSSSSSSSSSASSSSPSYAYLVKTPVTIYGIAYESNLSRACAALNGEWVATGEYFSFNTLVGPRTKENGYLEAINGRGSEVVGGGVSQVASTLHLALRRTGHVQYSEFSTYGDKFTAGYVDNPADAVVTDYRNNRDFSFTNYGEGFTIYMWCDGDYVYCGLAY